MKENRENPQDKLVPINIRFPAGVLEVISTVAKKNKTSIAQLVRMLVENRLTGYLSSVHYIDEKQGDDIQKELYNLSSKLDDIKFELNRIGVNYNQDVRIKNIKEKYKYCTDSQSVLQQGKEIIAIRNGGSLDKDELENILQRYEAATKKAGEELCRILE